MMRSESNPLLRRLLDVKNLTSQQNTWTLSQELHAAVKLAKMGGVQASDCKPMTTDMIRVDISLKRLIPRRSYILANSKSQRKMTQVALGCRQLENNGIIILLMLCPQSSLYVCFSIQPH